MFSCQKINLEAVISMQVNVVTQRGFIPVDERMRVIDGKGTLVGFICIYIPFPCQQFFLYAKFISTCDRFRTCTALVMPMVN